MKVSYNRRLVGLHTEVRILAGQGYNIPHKIMTTSEMARKFAKLARDLERIANFHNTIGDRMITSQRPLMLDAAVSLAQLVKEQTDMTWNILSDSEDEELAAVGGYATSRTPNRAQSAAHLLIAAG